MRIEPHSSALLSKFGKEDRYMLPVRTVAFVRVLCTALAAVAAVASTTTLFGAARIGNLSFIFPAQAQPAAPIKAQSDALSAYNSALNAFKAVLKERRAQIN